MIDSNLESTVVKHSRAKHTTTIVISTLFVLLFLALCSLFLNTATADFPIATPVRIEEGESIATIGKKLEAGNYIHSPLLFKVLLRYANADTRIQAGTYTFGSPMSTYELIAQLEKGLAESPGISITFPEGYTVKDWDMYTNNHFNEEALMNLIENEGYLFPDTYFVSEDESAESLVLRMKAHYEETVGPLRPQMEEQGYTEEEVIILASILEREANSEESMRRVAGILLNRLSIDMPLQVDAVFQYYTGKGSRDLTTEDLTTDTPYNTYTNIGLPPTPIGNPGLMAVKAVLNPISSDDYYYLTGNDGEFYYAKTHEEHVRNKARYLR